MQNEEGNKMKWGRLVRSALAWLIREEEVSLEKWHLDRRATWWGAGHVKEEGERSRQMGQSVRRRGKVWCGQMGDVQWVRARGGERSAHWRQERRVPRIRRPGSYSNELSFYYEVQCFWEFSRHNCLSFELTFYFSLLLLLGSSPPSLASWHSLWRI